MKRKRVVVLGATGSIGESALKVAHDIPERMEIVGLAANSNARKLAAQANAVRPKAVCLVDESKLDELRAALEYEPQIFSGEAGLSEIACLDDAEMVLVAVVGTGGLRPALAAIEAGKDLAVASKEILVMAGEIVMRAAREKGVQVLPVDSEHNAIFQCSIGRNANVQRGGQRRTKRFAGLILTASGGPFRETPASEFESITPEQALQASDLEHGTEDHDRFGHALQQRPRDDRGALAFRRGNEARGSGDSSAKHRAFDGGICGRLGPRAAQPFGHVFPDSIRGDLAGARAEFPAAARFREAAASWNSPRRVTTIFRR